MQPLTVKIAGDLETKRPPMPFETLAAQLRMDDFERAAAEFELRRVGRWWTGGQSDPILVLKVTQ